MATVLPMVLAPFYVGAALIGLLFPLDIMMAADSNPKLVYQKGELQFSITGSWERGCLCALLGLAWHSACIWCAVSKLATAVLQCWAKAAIKRRCPRYQCSDLPAGQRHCCCRNWRSCPAW